MFIAMGAENVSIEYLSTVLKQQGHTVMLEFDRALFNDKQYFSVNFLAKMFSDKKRVIRNIIQKQPDVLALSCFTDNYQWNASIAREVKKALDIPVIIGGYHPTSAPDTCLEEGPFDFVCVGEGEVALVQLLKILEKKKEEKQGVPGWYQDEEYPVGNIYYKRYGQAVKNSLLPNADPNTWPEPDKEIFESFIDIKNYYLTVTLKGCIQKCTFCGESFLWDHENTDNKLGKFLREKPVETVLSEFKKMKARYDIKIADIKNNILSGSKTWRREFLTRYKDEVAVPFRIMGHPLQMADKEYCQLLKDAHCWHVQMGVETMNSDVRKLLDRDETNEHVYQSVANMDEVGLEYSCDFILGLPGETEEDIVRALRMVTKAKKLRRASVFWLQYLPGAGITKHALEKGFINQSIDLSAINRGLQDHYMSTGSVLESERIHFLKMYHILFRLAPVMPYRLLEFILKHKFQRVFKYVPMQTLIIAAIDVVVSYIKNDHYAKMAVRSVLKDAWKRLIHFQIDWLAPFRIKGKVTTSEQGVGGLTQLPSLQIGLSQIGE